MRRPTWSNSKHAAQWKSTLSTYAYPVIGSKYLDEIKSSDVLTVLTPIWTSKPETASRVRQRLETVFDWAIAQGWRLDNPAGKAIARVLPSVPRGKNHHTALKDYADVPATLEQVKRSTAELETRLSLEFLVLTAARSSEVRLARWSEIDWESKTWTIPEDRMKARREHRVPLADRALEILVEARELDGLGSGLVFPAGQNGKPLSNATHLALLRRLGIPAVPHGFPKQLQGLVHGAHRYPVGLWGRPPWLIPWAIQRKQLTPEATFLTRRRRVDGIMGRIPGQRRGGGACIGSGMRMRDPRSAESRSFRRPGEASNGLCEIGAGYCQLGVKAKRPAAPRRNAGIGESSSGAYLSSPDYVIGGTLSTCGVALWEGNTSKE